MSDVIAGEEYREEAENRPDLVNVVGVGKRDPSDCGGKRDSSASSGSEGSQQQPTQTVQSTVQIQSSRGQAQPSEELIDVETEKTQVNRHVEASPQGRYLRFEDKLGTGQYKVVYRSYDTSMGIEVAWNTVNIKNLPKEEKRRIKNEVQLLQNLEHKNLVQFHGSWVNREKEEVVFVTEIMQSGSLMDFIRKVEMIRWRVVKRWARQILRGVNYLHSQDPLIIHRDLKCDNIFINGAAGDIRIGDLGLSTSNTRSEKTMSVLGTPEFMAPELYEEFYTEKVDIYAFGMCMLEMVTKERPYSECFNAAQIYRKVTSKIPPSALERVQNVRAREFIRVCLSPDPEKRPSAMELLNYPFLKDKNDDEDNTLVMLDPLVAEGHAPDPATTVGAPSLGTGKDAHAKIDPQLPGVSHPAQKGTPELDTIEEASSTSGSLGAAPQVPTPTGGWSQGHSADLTSVGMVAVTSASSSQGEAASSSPGESLDASTTGDAPIRRSHFYNSVPMLDSGGNEVGEGVNEGLCAEAGGEEKSGLPSVSVHQLPYWKTEGGEATVELEGTQFGVHKIPGNPPYESDDEELDNDGSHPERFLGGMPEDESAMRVLKLPNGRVRRSADDDDDEAGSENGSGDDDDDTVPLGLTAPSWAQAPPLSSCSVVETAMDSGHLPPLSINVVAEPTPLFLSAPRPPAVTTASPPSGGPVMQAPRPPALSAHMSSAPIVLAPRPPSSIAPKQPAIKAQRTSATVTPSTVASSMQVLRSQTTITPSPGASIMSQAPRPPMASAPVAFTPSMQAPRAPTTTAPTASAHTMQMLRSWPSASQFSVAPSMQAPRPPTAAAFFSGAPSMQAPRPPTTSAPQAVAPVMPAPRPPMGSPVSHSSGRLRGASFSGSNAESGSLTLMKGASTPGTVSPPMMFRSGTRLVSSTFKAVRGVVASDQTTAASMAALGSDPGFVTPPVGSAVSLQRARSFSPVEHVAQDASTAGSFSAFTSTPTAPAPSFPAPQPPGMTVDAMDHSMKMQGHSTGNVNGAGSGAPMIYGRGDKQLTASQPGDPELQESLSGSGGGVAPGRFPTMTMIKLANLQGTEREMMKMVIHVIIDGRLQEVEFDFNLEEEHPDQVSLEMIRELGLSFEEHGPISAMISNLATEARRRRGRRPSSNSSIKGSFGAVSFGSSGGEFAASGGSEGADNDPLAVSLPSGVEEVLSEDEADIEEDDEYRSRKLIHDRKKRQAEKAYEARLAALLAARSDRTDEHIRAQERYKKECDDFDKKVEKLLNEKERRMNECLNELRGLEDGYRQRYRVAKQAKRHVVTATGHLSTQIGMVSVSQPPLEVAPTPTSYAQLRSDHGQRFGESAPYGGPGQQGQLSDDGPDEPRLLSDQVMKLSQFVSPNQFNSNEGQIEGGWTSSMLQHQRHQQHQQHGANNLGPKMENDEEARRDRLSTL